MRGALSAQFHPFRSVDSKAEPCHLPTTAPCWAQARDERVMHAGTSVHPDGRPEVVPGYALRPYRRPVPDLARAGQVQAPQALLMTLCAPCLPDPKPVLAQPSWGTSRENAAGQQRFPSIDVPQQPPGEDSHKGASCGSCSCASSLDVGRSLRRFRRLLPSA